MHLLLEKIIKLIVRKSNIIVKNIIQKKLNKTELVINEKTKKFLYNSLYNKKFFLSQLVTALKSQVDDENNLTFFEINKFYAIFLNYSLRRFCKDFFKTFRL